MDRTKAPDQKLHLLILGATGPSGLRTVELALVRQHTLTVYVRSPDKLPQSITLNPLVTTVKGELNDVAALSTCFAPREGLRKIDAIISALGAKVGQPKGNPLTKGYEILLAKMKEFSVPRLIFLSSVSVTSRHDHFSLVRESMVAGIMLIGYTSWEDVVATGKLMESDAAKGLQITIARVPTLTDGAGGSLHVGYIGSNGQGWTLARVDLATFFIGEAENPAWVGEAPLCSSKLDLSSCV
ncbi:NAD(P)-binding protein [Clavulina sp. PMI_390]|nr:NAD(P)-binding protein [Clavulina sp. PMI_390]